MYVCILCVVLYFCLSFVIVTFNRINNNNKHDDDLDMLIMSRVKSGVLLMTLWSGRVKQTSAAIN